MTGVVSFFFKCLPKTSGLCSFWQAFKHSAFVGGSFLLWLNTHLQYLCVVKQCCSVPHLWLVNCNTPFILLHSHLQFTLSASPFPRMQVLVSPTFLCLCVTRDPVVLHSRPICCDWHTCVTLCCTHTNTHTHEHPAHINPDSQVCWRSNK